MSDINMDALDEAYAEIKDFPTRSGLIPQWMEELHVFDQTAAAPTRVKLSKL